MTPGAAPGRPEGRDRRAGEGGAAGALGRTKFRGSFRVRKRDCPARGLEAPGNRPRRRRGVRGARGPGSVPFPRVRRLPLRPERLVGLDRRERVCRLVVIRLRELQPSLPLPADRGGLARAGRSQVARRQGALDRGRFPPRVLRRPRGGAPLPDPAARGDAEWLVGEASPGSGPPGPRRRGGFTPDNETASLYHLATHDGEVDTLLAASPPRVRSEFDVHLVDFPSGGKWLVFASDGCPGEVFDGLLIVHLVPEEPDDLPLVRRLHGFDNRSFRFADRAIEIGERCVARRRFPTWPVRSVVVGYSARPPGGGTTSLGGARSSPLPTFRRPKSAPSSEARSARPAMTPASRGGAPPPAAGGPRRPRGGRPRRPIPLSRLRRRPRRSGTARRPVARCR